MKTQTKVAIAAALSLTALGSLTACTTATTPSAVVRHTTPKSIPAPAPSKPVGQALSNPEAAGGTINVLSDPGAGGGAFSVTVQPVVFNDSAEVAAANEFNAAPAPGDAFAKLTVTVKNTGTESIDAGVIGTQFTFLDAQGNQTTIDITDYVGTPLSANINPLPAGASVTGTQLFELPVSDTTGTVVLDGSAFWRAN